MFLWGHVPDYDCKEQAELDRRFSEIRREWRISIEEQYAQKKKERAERKMRKYS